MEIVINWGDQIFFGTDCTSKNVQLEFALKPVRWEATVIS
jgi:hypothetical protein